MLHITKCDWNTEPPPSRRPGIHTLQVQRAPTATSLKRALSLSRYKGCLLLLSGVQGPLVCLQCSTVRKDAARSGRRCRATWAYLLSYWPSQEASWCNSERCGRLPSFGCHLPPALSGRGPRPYSLHGLGLSGCCGRLAAPGLRCERQEPLGLSGRSRLQSLSVFKTPGGPA